MRAPRQGKRLNWRARKRPRTRLEELTERARREARAMSRRQQADARRQVGGSPSFEGLGTQLRDAGKATRSRLNPVLEPVGRAISAAAPHIAGALFLPIEAFARAIGWLAGAVPAALTGLWKAGAASLKAADRTLERQITPVRAAAAVAAAAALALAVSQFFDYRGVAVDVQAYSGEVGTVANVPLTDKVLTGSAHIWLGLPLAAAALVLTVLSLRGRRELGWGVAICGVLGLALAIAVDLPQGLDAGRAGLAFSDAEARLLEGFWAEVVACGALCFSGLLLALYPRDVAEEERGRRGPRLTGRPGRRTRGNVGEVGGGLQAGS